jgi:hypothetical protein
MGDVSSQKGKIILEIFTLLSGENNELDLKKIDGEDLVANHLLQFSVERIAFVNMVGNFAFH